MGARALDATHARRGRGRQPDTATATHLRHAHVHASLVTQSDSRSRATLARPPRRENEAARDVSVRAVQPAQGEGHACLVAASTLSAVPGQRVGEQALLASRRRPARSLKRFSAPAADGALRSRHEVGTRAGTPSQSSARRGTATQAGRVRRRRPWRRRRSLRGHRSGKALERPLQWYAICIC